MANIANDAFTESSDTDLTAHTPTSGGSWTAAPGSAGTGLYIRGATDDVGPKQNNNNNAYHSADPPSADYSVQMYMAVGADASSSAHVWGRMSTSANTGYLAGMTGGSYPYNGQEWDLSKVVAGTFTQLAFSAATPASKTIKLDMVGTTIRLLLDGVQEHSVSDSAISAAGKTGLSVASFGDVYVDNWTADSAASPPNTLVVADVAQGQAPDAVVLTQQNVLAVAEIAQTQTLDAVALTQANALDLADVSQEQALDAVALTQANILAVADLLQAQGLEGVVLVQQNTLAVADVQQDQVLDAVVLSIATLLTVADVLQSQSLETVALVQQYVLVIQDALQAQLLDGLVLGQANTLVVADVSQGQGLAGVVLLFPSLQQPFETSTATARSLSHTAGSRSHNWTAPRRQN